MTTIMSKGLDELLQQDPAYREKYESTVLHAGTKTFGQLKVMYPDEFSSWRGRKSWAKTNKVEWDEYIISFEGFLCVMGPIPAKKWTLDRINPTGPYRHENLRWASKATQSANRTTSRFIDVGGVKMSIHQIATRTGSTYNAVRMALKRFGDKHALALIAKFDAHNPHADLWDFPEKYREELTNLYEQAQAPTPSRAEYFSWMLTQEIRRQEFREGMCTRANTRVPIMKLLVELRTMKSEVSDHMKARKREQALRELEARHTVLYRRIEQPTE